MRKILSVLILCSVVLACSVSKQNEISKTDLLEIENESLLAMLAESNANTKNEIATFLTFQDNNAENAMDFYVGLFDNSSILTVKRWEKGAPGEEGRIMHATFDLNGSLFMCSDSPPIHEWGFTPAVSNYIECENESELERLFTALSENGKVMMPLHNYGFSQKFGFVEDQFGVSWQLNLQ